MSSSSYSSSSCSPSPSLFSDYSSSSYSCPNEDVISSPNQQASFFSSEQSQHTSCTFFRPSLTQDCWGFPFSPLHVAVWFRDIETLQLLLPLSPSGTPPSSPTACRSASANYDCRQTSGGRFDVDSVDHHGHTPLMLGLRLLGTLEEEECSCVSNDGRGVSRNGDSGFSCVDIDRTNSSIVHSRITTINCGISSLHRNGYLSVVRLLLRRGANPQIKDKAGWSSLDQTVSLRDPALIREIFIASHRHKRLKWRTQRTAQFSQALLGLPNFLLDIRWEFESIVIPWMKQLTPHDTLKIYKKDANVRIDSTFISWKPLRTKRRPITTLFIGLPPHSFDKGLSLPTQTHNQTTQPQSPARQSCDDSTHLNCLPPLLVNSPLGRTPEIVSKACFSGTAIPAVPPRLLVLNHSKRTYSSAVSAPDDEEIDWLVEDFMTSDPVHGDMELEDVELSEPLSLFGNKHCPKVGQWRTRRIDLKATLVFRMKRKCSRRIILSFEEYFGIPPPESTISLFTKPSPDAPHNQHRKREVDPTKMRPRETRLSRCATAWLRRPSGDRSLAGSSGSECNDFHSEDEDNLQANSSNNPIVSSSSSPSFFSLPPRCHSNVSAQSVRSPLSISMPSPFLSPNSAVRKLNTTSNTSPTYRCSLPAADICSLHRSSEAADRLLPAKSILSSFTNLRGYLTPQPQLPKPGSTLFPLSTDTPDTIDRSTTPCGFSSTPLSSEYPCSSLTVSPIASPYLYRTHASPGMSGPSWVGWLGLNRVDCISGKGACGETRKTTSTDSVDDRADTKRELRRKATIMLWVSRDFPLSLDQFLDLIEVSAIQNKTIEKLVGFLKSDKVRRFVPLDSVPVRVSIPLNLAVRVVITFQAVQVGNVCDALFGVPADYTRQSRKEFQKIGLRAKKRTFLANLTV